MGNDYFDTDTLDTDEHESLLDNNFSGSYQSKRRQLDEFFEEKKLRSEIDSFNDYFEPANSDDLHYY